MKLTDCKQLSLKNVKITGDVIGKFGTFEIEQTFVNNTRNVLEVGYTFPIVETATVVGFEVQIGDKILKGQCKETSKAKKEYTKNIVKGNSAYLMEEESDNIFAITIGKLDKGEEVKIKINYIDKFEIIDNQVQILIPTLVPQKYNSRITDKLKYGKVDYTVDFYINIAKNVNCTNIQSPTHKIQFSETEKGQLVEVLNYDMSKDFKLYFDFVNELTSNAITSKTRDGKNVLYLSFMPEITDSYEDSEKEYLFLVDVSGSMYGEKLEETKHAVIECLKQLDDGDKFNIIPFESEFEAMSINSLEYNEENLKKAIKYVKSLTDKGGTEILDPIKFALYEDDSDKIILLFTDGEVGNEEEIITFVENNIGNSKLFPFGIDYNVNSYFLRDLAKVGNGKAELIMPQERIDDKIIRTFARIQTPLLEDIRIDYGKNKILDEIRENNALFNYEFYNVFAKTEHLDNDIILEGRIIDKEYSWAISKDSIIKTDIDLEIIFAKMRIDQLEDYIRKCNDEDKIQGYIDLIVELSEKYNINSKYTSFLTVYEREDKIFEAPTYQETTLSAKYSSVKRTLYDIDDFCGVDFLVKGFEPREACYDCCDDIGVVEEIELDSIKRTENPTISDKSILEDKVNEYYKEFITQADKSLVTYLLFALYYLRKDNSDFDYNDLIDYLIVNKNEIKNNKEIQELLYLLCNGLNTNYLENSDYIKLFEILNDDIKKVIMTGLNYGVTRKGIAEEDISEILANNTVPEHIDSILWYYII